MKKSEIIGYVLLSPALISTLLFFISLLTGADTLKGFNYLDKWTGDYSDGGGYTSALPLYLGLMAISGAYLIKEK
ncbi:MAG: hypothetical protein RLZZ323_28 [Bacteroidota bacterium]|jgi:hypothetical protein